MPLQLDVFLLILRLLLIVLLYLFLMQVVIAITRDLKKTEVVSANPENRAPPVVGHLLVLDHPNGLISLAANTRFDLAPITTIGRGPTNTIRLTDKFISSDHTRIENHNGAWYVRDGNSKYGTFVNNQQVPPDKPIIAQSGDIVRVGFINFQLIQ